MQDTRLAGEHSIPMEFVLNPAADPAAAAASIRTHGRGQIRDVLDAPSATRITQVLKSDLAWTLVTHLEGRHRVFDAAAIDRLPAENLQPLREAINTTARDGFAYLYENIPIYDLWHSRASPDHPLLPLVDLLNSDPFLTLVRQASGHDDIAFADAQVTRFRAGHFLTTHDDNAAGKNRRAAYVLNLTPEWSPDWGGQLQFFDQDGNVTAGFTPAYNVLNIFLVPTQHSVAIVAPFAGGPRLSITGWLRAGSDPGPG